MDKVERKRRFLPSIRHKRSRLGPLDQRAPNWTGKFEYLYANFGTDSYLNRDGNRAEFGNDIHTIRVGLNYQF